MQAGLDIKGHTEYKQLAETRRAAGKLEGGKEKEKDNEKGNEGQTKNTSCG